MTFFCFVFLHGVYIPVLTIFFLVCFLPHILSFSVRWNPPAAQRNSFSGHWWAKPKCYSSFKIKPKHWSGLLFLFCNTSRMVAFFPEESQIFPCRSCARAKSPELHPELEECLQNKHGLELLLSFCQSWCSWIEIHENSVCPNKSQWLCFKSLRLCLFCGKMLVWVRQIVVGNIFVKIICCWGWVLGYWRSLQVV